MWRGHCPTSRLPPYSAPPSKHHRASNLSKSANSLNSRHVHPVPRPTPSIEDPTTQPSAHQLQHESLISGPLSQKSVSTVERLGAAAKVSQHLLDTGVVRVPLEDGGSEEGANEDADDDVAWSSEQTPRQHSNFQQLDHIGPQITTSSRPIRRVWFAPGPRFQIALGRATPAGDAFRQAAWTPNRSPGMQMVKREKDKRRNGGSPRIAFPSAENPRPGGRTKTHRCSTWPTT